MSVVFGLEHQSFKWQIWLFFCPILYLACVKIVEQAKKGWLHNLQFEDSECITSFYLLFFFGTSESFFKKKPRGALY